MKKLPPTRAWRLDEKVTTRETRPQHSGSPLLQPAYCSRPRPLTYRTRANAPQILTAPARRKTAAIFARAAAYTQQRQFLAEGVAAAMRRRRARASHITGGAAATQTPTKKRRRRAPTQTSPRALQPPTHTPNPAGLPLQGGGSPRTTPRRRFDGSNDTYTARGSTKVLSEKQRQDPDHGNSCGGERVVLRRR